jgi:hypothetical protein
VERIPDPASLVQESAWDAQWDEHLRATAIEQVKRKVEPLEYQIFDLCVLRGSPPATVAARLKVKPWKVYFARKKVARLLQQQIQRLESAAHRQP